MDEVCAITTIDNPFDPIDQFDSWLDYDLLSGHNCCAVLARFAKTSSKLSEKENCVAIEIAIDEIVLNDLEGIYKKVKHKPNSSFRENE